MSEKQKLILRIRKPNASVDVVEFKNYEIIYDPANGFPNMIIEV